MDNILVRAYGDFEVYQFMEGIEEFTEFYRANQDNFSIFEIADLSDIERTRISDQYTVYDMTLKHSADHFWLIKDEETGMYEPIDSEAQLEAVVDSLKD